MDSLVNFDGMADVCNNLIDKVASAVGWIVSHDTPRRIAISNYINEIQASDYDPLTKAALISNAQKSIKEYENQHKIYEIATQALLPSAKPEKVDDDWIAQFMDKARLVSNSDFQILWGNILAEECNTPGSVPKVLLHIMEQMDRSMAEGFMKVASVSVQWMENGIQDASPVFFNYGTDDYYKNLGITLDMLVNLQSIGLIKMDFGVFAVSYMAQLTDSSTPIRYFDENYHLPENESELPIGNIIFTKAGTALYLAVHPNKIDGFFYERCIPVWQKAFSDRANQKK